MTKPITSQNHRQKPKSRSQWIKEQEFTLCGWNTCLQAFEHRPQEIRRVFFSKERSHLVGAITQWCGEHKLPFRLLDPESLNKAAGSIHHEGIVMVVRPLQRETIHNLLQRGVSSDSLLVALDRVGNVHNVGAILRSCAYFGTAGLLVGTDEGQAMMTPAAARTAEGAMEIVPVYECTDLPSALRDLHARKVFVLGADLNADRSLHETEVPFPCVVVVGNEHEGLSERVKQRCDALVYVPGTPSPNKNKAGSPKRKSPSMQSLNVSVAAGVLLAELCRRKLIQK